MQKAIPTYKRQNNKLGTTTLLQWSATMHHMLPSQLCMYDTTSKTKASAPTTSKISRCIILNSLKLNTVIYYAKKMPQMKRVAQKEEQKIHCSQLGRLILG